MLIFLCLVLRIAFSSSFGFAWLLLAGCVVVLICSQDERERRSKVNKNRVPVCPAPLCVNRWEIVLNFVIPIPLVLWSEIKILYMCLRHEVYGIW